MITASKLDRVVACPASEVLPHSFTVQQNQPAARGTAIHRFLATVGTLGREKALAEVPEEWRADCALIELERLPTIDPASFAAEQAIAYDVETRTARDLGRGIDREYVEIGPNEIPGTLDSVGLDADGQTVICLDYKTGWTRRDVRRSWQLLFAAVAACALYGRSRARVGFARLRDDGRVWIEWAEVEAFDLDAAADELVDLLRRVRRERKAWTEHSAPTRVYSGDHCRYCPAYHHCPEQIALARALADRTSKTERELRESELTPELAGAALLELRRLKAITARIEEQLTAYAEREPIPLGNGRVYARVKSPRSTVVGKVALRVLTERYGAEAACVAVEMETSKTAIKEALKPLVVARKAKGEKVSFAGELRDVLSAIAAAGGVEERTVESVGERNAAPGELPSTEDAADLPSFDEESAGVAA